VISPGTKPVLTPAQQLVVDQPWDARTLVTAGAGAGKTTTLTYRLEALTGREELGAAEILVLSFSRAAVREVRDRIDRQAVSARRVRAQTFDSWAASLLRQAYPDRDLSGTTFDERIQEATAAIEAGAVEATEHGAPAHVIIDEVQDLVGVRRDMVEALLDRLRDGCGFTVVGDAAQSVYGFQITNLEERARETNRFLDWVRASFNEDLLEVVLADNFRAHTEEARMALPFGARIQSLPGDPEKAAKEAEALYSELRMLLETAPEFGDFDELFAQDSLRDFDGTCAVLCRDNGQMLYLSQKLHAAGVDHRLQRSPRDRPTPPWLTGLFAMTTAGSLTEERFTEITATLTGDGDLAPDRVWRSLRRAAGAPRNTLDLEKLRSVIAQGSLPDELTAASAHRLVLSTIHRAKGLEFDRVLIVEPESPVAMCKRNGGDYDRAGELRLLYVAMTRARHDIFRISRPNTWKLRKHKRTGRWYIGGRETYVRMGIEATGGDVNHDFPAGAGDPAADPAAVQRYLAGTVQANDLVELYRLHELPAGPSQTPPYGIFHNGSLIGEVSERFRRDLWCLLKTGRDVWNTPGRILDLRVEGSETVAGTSAAGERVGLDSSGVWLAPRLTGLGRFDWQHEDPMEGGGQDR